MPSSVRVSCPRPLARIHGRTWLLLSVALLLAPAPAPAQSEGCAPDGERNIEGPTREVDGFVFRFEEDAFLRVVPTTDRNYTGGGSIGLSGNWVKRAYLLWPLDQLDRALGLGACHVDRGGNVPRTIQRYAAEFGIVAFAPLDLTQRDVDHGDRPYASMDYLQVSRLSAYDAAGVALKTELRLGILGLDHAHQIQAAIHRAGRRAKGCSDSDPDCTPHDPKGWSHQISAGGEPTLGYGIQLERRVLSSDAFGVNVFEAKAFGRGDLGHLTSLALGGTVRMGLIQSPFWAFDASPMVETDQEVAQRVGGWLAPELFAFASLDGRATLYNAMLQGQFRHSDRRVGWREMRHFLYDYSIGARVAVAHVSLTWVALAGRSPEASFRETRHHQWASFFLSINWPS